MYIGFTNHKSHFKLILATLILSSFSDQRWNIFAVTDGTAIFGSTIMFVLNF